MIKETIELLGFAFDLQDAIKKAKEDDGNVTWTDALSFTQPVFVSLPVAVIGIQKVPTELKEFTPEELTEVVDYFESRFDLTRDDLEAKVMETLDLMVKLFLVWR